MTPERAVEDAVWASDLPDPSASDARPGILYTNPRSRKTEMDPPASRAARTRRDALLEAASGFEHAKQVFADATEAFTSQRPVRRSTRSLSSVRPAKKLYDSQVSDRHVQDQMDLTRAIASSLGEAICATDLEGRLVFVNAAAEQLLGCKEDELLGRVFNEAVHLRRADGNRKPVTEYPVMRLLRSDATALSHDEVLIMPDGTACSAACVSSRMTLDGEVIGVVVVFRKRTENPLPLSEEHFRLLAQDSSNMIAIVEADGIIRHQSASTERVLGHKPEQLIGTSGYSLVHPDDIPRAERFHAELMGAPAIAMSTRLRLRHRDGTWRQVDATGNNLLDDPIVRGIVLSARNVSECDDAGRARVSDALPAAPVAGRGSFGDARAVSAARAAHAAAAHQRRPRELLTAREREVIALLVQGVTSDRELAERLVVSHNTVKYHLGNILGKLHLRDRAQIVAYALSHEHINPRVVG